MLKLTVIAVLCVGVRSQMSSGTSSYGSPSTSSSSYGSSPSSSSSYSSPSSSSYGSPSTSSMSASPASSVSYPSVNMPLLSIPVTVGNASFSTGTTGTTSTGTTSVNATNYLATLGAAITNISPPSYSYGVYPNDYDASRAAYYDHSNYYPLNIYTNPISGLGGPLNLSSPVQVAAAQWFAPYPYRLAQWNDGYTTQGSVIANTTAAATVTATTVATVGSSGSVGVVNASLYYAAYGGSISGLGQPGLGLQVPGPAPQNYLTPGFNTAYNVGSSPASSTSTGTGTSTSSTGSSYGSSPSSYSPSTSSSYGSSSPTASSSSYSGRRRRAIDFASVMRNRQMIYR